ncbi:MAG: hypothetical protein M3N39_03860 [Pseudomonadota bacterium]|nr:hypothetical protein [Pseudomonadota bacterium]
MTEAKWRWCPAEGSDRLRPIADIAASGKTACMGKRSGVPDTDDELAKLSRDELEAELQRSKVRLTIAGSAKVAKQWHKRIHWLESALTKRD